MIQQVLNIPVPDTAQAERLVLSDLTVSPQEMGEVVTTIHPDFFTSDSRRQIWEYMVERFNRGEAFDTSTLMMHFPKTFIQELSTTIAEHGGSIATQQHARALRDGAAKRRAYIAAASFLRDCTQPGVTEGEIAAGVEAFARTVEGPAPMCEELPIGALLEKVKENVARTAQAIKEGKRVRVTTGFFYMDDTFNGGFKPGQLVVLAARPSIGKTALMLQMAKAAATAGTPVQVFSLEMQAEELAERMLYSTGEVHPFDITHGSVQPTSFARAEKQLGALPFYINDFSRSLDDIVARMTRAAKRGRCGIAFIDYLGLIRDALNFGNAKLYQVIARVTGTLKAVAKRLEIPIVLLCQLNRDAAREDREPELYDLRDSGSIEQDADIVLMLHGHRNKELGERYELHVHLRKHRGGKKDITFVTIPNKTYSAFEEEKPIRDDDDDDLPVQVKEGARSLSELITGSIATRGNEPDEDDNLPF